MIGDFRFFRQAEGVTAFCHIRVEVQEKPPGEPEVVPAIPDDADSARPSEEPGWFSAATAGILECLRDLRQKGEDFSKQIRIVSLVSTYADARPDAISAAAFMATVDALGRKERYRIEYRDGQWQILQR